MISQLIGTIAQRGHDRIVLLVGGVGFEVFAPRTTLDKIKQDQQEVALHTRLVVREDALTLFGFATESERDIFDVLIKINGVGPRLALAILGTLSLDNLRNAVASEKPELLTRVPGVGKKTAQKILLELKGKLAVGLDAVPIESFDDLNAQVMDALIALGYSVVEAQSAIQTFPPNAPDNVEERVLLALQYLGS